MELMSPNAERRLETPLKELAETAPDWRGVSTAKLAEQYAAKREVEEKEPSAAEGEAGVPQPEDEPSPGWIRRFLRVLGVN